MYSLADDAAAFFRRHFVGQEEAEGGSFEESHSEEVPAGEPVPEAEPAPAG
jgi:hypothetical protein